jgi:hypothetical protein
MKIIGVGDIEYLRPEGCKCPDHTWCDTPNPICDNYEPEDIMDRCRHCEHDPDCHERVNWN